MTLWSKVGILVAILAIYGASVWHAHTVYDSAQLSDQLAAEIAQHQKDQQAANDRAADLEEALKTERQNALSLSQKWSDYAKHVPDCPLSHHALRVLHEATSGTGRDAR